MSGYGEANGIFGATLSNAVQSQINHTRSRGGVTEAKSRANLDDASFTRRVEMQL